MPLALTWRKSRAQPHLYAYVTSSPGRFFANITGGEKYVKSARLKWERQPVKVCKLMALTIVSGQLVSFFCYIISTFVYDVLCSYYIEMVHDIPSI